MATVRNFKRLRAVFCASLIMAVGATAAYADRPQTDTEKKAIDYLLHTQAADGSWVAEAGPGVTALVVQGLAQGGHASDAGVEKGLAFIMKSHQADGGFYGDSHATYSTAITLSMLAALPTKMKAKYAGEIKAAQDFLKSIQSGADGAAKDDQGKAVTKDHPWFGGWGYGEGSKLKAGRRPDLSNTQFVIDALRSSGVPATDPSIQNALVFLSRTQAVEGNDLPWAKGRNDGGFIYSMGFNKTHNFYGQSEGPDTKDREGNEVLTTYGSMTYSGLKSMLYADLKKDDPRVVAALRWISGNYTLDVNPGLNNSQGLFYYYHSFTAALNAYGQDTITDAKGVQHDWRSEFEAVAAKKQAADGSFVNAADRWMESNPMLVTSYAVLSLQKARGL